MQKTFTTQEKNQDDRQFSQLLSQVAPQKDHRFIGHEQTYETIYTDKLACLKKCQELRDECIQKNEKWSDPEFGPTEKDPHALSALYFYENMIPLGCPDPDTIEWLRPSTILDNQSITTAPCFFSDGASSNDVL